VKDGDDLRDLWNQQTPFADRAGIRADISQAPR
jgi:hypothetical protein